MTLEELKRKKISAISLGCDKNRVDLEKMLYNLKNFGFNVVAEVNDADIVIVNTCAFIQSATDEALSNIFAMLSLKGLGLEKVIVTGCLVSRYKDQIKGAIKEVDAFIDIKDNDKIVNTICSLYGVNTKYEQPLLQPSAIFKKAKCGWLVSNLPFLNSYLVLTP